MYLKCYYSITYSLYYVIMVKKYNAFITKIFCLLQIKIYLRTRKCSLQFVLNVSMKTYSDPQILNLRICTDYYLRHKWY